jgi:hypothetical protein
MRIDQTNDSQKERPFTAAISGCLYAALVITVSAGMLLTNAFLCLTIYAAIPKYGNEDLTSRLGQLFFIVAPVILMVVEWNLLDRVNYLFRSRT